MALFLFSKLFHCQKAERRITMSLFTIFSGRPTKDPVMQQAKNSATEYISLDIAVPRRKKDGKDDALFIHCYFNKSLADRLLNAKVKKGSCIQIRGDLDIDAFLYNQGQPGVNANCYVENWEFCLSNRQNSGQDFNHGQNGNYQPNGNNQNGIYPSGGGQNNRNPNGNTSGGSYAGKNGPNGGSANSRNINGGYSGNVPGGVPAQANGYGNPNQNAGGGYGYNPNPGDSYYSEGFGGVPQEPLPYN